MTKHLREFFAVTRTSVYHVQARAPYVASATKIALTGSSKAPVGKDIAEGGMIAVGYILQAYTPEGCGATSPETRLERDPTLVSYHFWGWHSSNIVGLFKNKDEAMACHAVEDKQSRDPRWYESTALIIAEIGDDHPSFFVFKDDRNALLHSA